MSIYKCRVCGYIHDDEKEKVSWRELADTWVCPLCSSDKSYFTTSNVYECSVCAYVYDEEKEESSWSDLKDEWQCPICSSGKLYFNLKDKEQVLNKEVSKEIELPSGKDRYLGEWERSSDNFETYMKDIHKIAETGKTIIESMISRIKYPSWDSLLFKGSQLSKPR